MDLVTEVYRMTEKCPSKEILSRQIRRAAVSVATNASTTWLDTPNYLPFTLTRI